MKKPRLTAEEAFRQIQENPAFRSRDEAQRAEIAQHTEARLKAEQPLVSALAAAGFRVTSVWDLVNTRATYSGAIPVLLEHLDHDYPDDVLEGIARALAVPEAKAAWPRLLELYRTIQEIKPNGLKTAFAAALSGVADENVVDTIAEIVKTPSHGESRILLLECLAVSRRREMHDALRQAGEDPQLAKQVKFLLRRYREHIRSIGTGGA